MASGVATPAAPAVRPWRSVVAEVVASGAGRIACDLARFAVGAWQVWRLCSPCLAVLFFLLFCEEMANGRGLWRDTLQVTTEKGELLKQLAALEQQADMHAKEMAQLKDIGWQQQRQWATIREHSWLCAIFAVMAGATAVVVIACSNAPRWCSTGMAPEELLLTLRDSQIEIATCVPEALHRERLAAELAFANLLETHLRSRPWTREMGNSLVYSKKRANVLRQWIAQGGPHIQQ